MNNKPVVKFASSPTGTPVGLPLKNQCKTFLMTSTVIPATGPIVNMASTAGISAKSNFKKPGIAGNGKLSCIKIVPTLPSIAIMTILRNFLLFICSSLLVRFTSKEERSVRHFRVNKKIPKLIRLRELPGTLRVPIHRILRCLEILIQ